MMDHAAAHDAYRMCRVDTIFVEERVRLTVATASRTLMSALCLAFDMIGGVTRQVGERPVGKMERVLQEWLVALLGSHE